MYFGQGKDFKLTNGLSEKVQYSHNQAIKKRKWVYTAYVNKRSFTFKVKSNQDLILYEGDSNSNLQPVKQYPILEACWRVNKHGDLIFCCIFLMFIAWILIMKSFNSSLIAEQFQGNHLHVPGIFVVLV